MKSLTEIYQIEGVLNALSSPLALLDSRAEILYVNRAWRDFGAENGPAITDSGVGLNYLAVCDAVAGADAATAQDAAAGIRAVLGSKVKQYVGEYPCACRAGNLWFRMMVTPCGGGDDVGALIMHVDITELRGLATALRIEATAVKRLNRVLAVLSGINALILRARSRAELFEGTCRIAVEAGGLRMALILLTDPDHGELVPAAWSGVDDDYLGVLTKALTSGAPTDSLLHQALSDLKGIASNDAPNDPTLLLRDFYAARGIRSVAALPLVVETRTLGLLVLYADETDVFHRAEMKLLSELSQEVAFAIDHIEKIERIDHLAYFDQCTGLANRSLFLQRVTERLSLAHRSGQKVCVILFDLEGFKNVNDAFGRDAGDSLLRQVAAWLIRHTDDETRIARVGPDQFAAVTRPFAHKPDLISYLDRDMAALLEHPFQLDGTLFRLAFKAGLALSPDDGASAAVLLNHAEVALKQAKKSRSRRLFYEHRMSEGVAGRLTLENQMRQALDKAEFVLNYQPKFSLATGRLSGVEALIRWNDPRGGMTSPGVFIPILEETGLILEVGRWVMRTAVEDYLRWRAAGLDAVRISVNVSPLQLRSPDFVLEVKRIVGVDATAAAGLELEITESVIVEDVRNSIVSLQAIRDGGVKIAIDDFGTGFSSLSYLAKLPVDTLKIDRSFVIDMVTGPRGRSLVSTIINLGHSLGLTVIAEGVETEAQARELRLFGCDEMQGYLRSRPISAQLFESNFLRAPMIAA